MSESEAPRLPPPVPGLAPLEPEPVDQPARVDQYAKPPSGGTSAARLRLAQWKEYEAPDLVSLQAARRFVIGSRLTVVAWSVIAVVVAASARSRALDGAEVRGIGYRLSVLGVLSALVVVIAGWFWSERATENVHRLSARLPSRVRCVTAWLMPIAWTALLVVAVLRLDPTELFDVRPVLISIVFVTAMWRPYSLVRRMIRSLIRVDSDVLVGAAFVLDVASMGLLWWRLQTFPDVVGVGEAGVTAALFGLAAVAVVAAGGNVAVWVYLLRAVDRAVGHRSVALHTRHDHRQLRSLGIDPLDPSVRRALQRIREEDAERELIASSKDDEAVGRVKSDVLPVAPAEDRPDVGAADVADVADVAEVVADGPAEVAAAAAAAAASEVEEQVETPDAPTVQAPAHEPLVEYRREAEPDEPTMPEESPIDRLAKRLAADPELTDPSPAGAPTASEEQRAEEPTRGVAGAVARSGSESAQPQPDIMGRLNTRAEALERLIGDLSEVDSRGPSILSRLEEFGISPGDAEVPVNSLVGRDDTDVVADETDLTVGRMFTLEIARYFFLASVVATIAAFAWVLMRATGVGDLIDGDIAGYDVDRLDVARRTAVTALNVALVSVPMWCGVAAAWSARVGLVVAGQRRCFALFGVVLAVNVFTVMVDPARGRASLLGALCGVGAAMWSLSVVIDIQRQFQQSKTVAAFLPITLAFAVATSWIGGFQRPITASDPIETMSFFGGLLVVAVAVVLVVAAISSADVVESIQLSPRRLSEGRAQQRSTPDDH